MNVEAQEESWQRKKNRPTLSIRQTSEQNQLAQFLSCTLFTFGQCELLFLLVFLKLLGVKLIH